MFTLIKLPKLLKRNIIEYTRHNNNSINTIVEQVASYELGLCLMSYRVPNSFNRSQHITLYE